MVGRGPTLVGGTAGAVAGVAAVSVSCIVSVRRIVAVAVGVPLRRTRHDGRKYSVCGKKTVSTANSALLVIAIHSFPPRPPPQVENSSKPCTFHGLPFSLGSTSTAITSMQETTESPTHHIIRVLVAPRLVLLVVVGHDDER